MLKPSEARAYYDRFGKKQDTQGFYEDPALEDLLAHAQFREAKKVFEFGCGTGRFADRLLGSILSPSATYAGCDISPTMVQLASQRLAVYADRAHVSQYDGALKFQLPDHSVDRVISTYVLDLLSEADIAAFLNEAFRVLNEEGKLCLVSLTRGTTFPSRFVSSVWSSVFRLNASWVGGCRPIRLEQHIQPGNWKIEYRHVVIPYGVPSEVLVASTTKDMVGDLSGILHPPPSPRP